MKEVIIKYTDSKTLELLKSLAGYLGFSVNEPKEGLSGGKREVSFTVLHVKPTDAHNYRFNRDEANER
ncbi:MAG TPA: hypothetical protein VFM90_07595 [Cyclobacteriaceae bacterium]|nr:hypothetical protein [Cyclobacteriaceae bacterium]